MKKIFTASLSLAICLSAGAEELKTLTLGLGEPGIDEPTLIGLGISPDGRYVCGPIDYGEGGFVMDVETGEFSFDYVEDTELRNVDLNGLAIGYMGDMGVTFSVKGDVTELEVPDNSCKYILGEDLTNDGRLKVGSIVAGGYISHAAISVDGGEWTKLPMPSEDPFGFYADGSFAKGISGDGKYIVGDAGNFGPVLMWTRGDDGSYTVYELYRRYCAYDPSEAAEKPLAGLFQISISNNGRYVLCRAAKYVIEDGYPIVKWFPAVYDTMTEELTQYDEPQLIDEVETGLTGTAIADDGTFVGMIGSTAMITSAGTFIMKKGETQAQLLSDVYPAYGEVFGAADALGNCVPTDISADGRYILGYSFYSEDFDDEMLPAYFVTYIIDTFSGSSVESVGSVSETEEIYSIDGVRLPEMKRGINIVRSSDGSVRKFIRK